jgi:hypothetical protein
LGLGIGLEGCLAGAGPAPNLPPTPPAERMPIVLACLPTLVGVRVRARARVSVRVRVRARVRVRVRVRVSLTLL